MISPQQINAFIEKISDASKEESRRLILQYIRNLADLVGSVEEIKEDLSDYDDIYQIIIEDIDLEGWFQIRKGTITYQEGYNDNYNLMFRMSKKLLVQIIKMEVMPFDAYMKGLIKVRGDISYTIRFRNFINDITAFILHGKNN